MIRLLAIVSLAAATLAACGSVPETEVELELVGAGIIESEQVVMGEDATSSVGAKRAQSGSMRIVQVTELIPLQPGVSYGIAFRIVRAPQDVVKLRAVLLSSAPCTLKTTGKVVYHNDSVLVAQVGRLRHLGARIPATPDESHCAGELEPSIDTFALYHGERKLAEARFQLYRPDAPRSSK